MDDTPADPVPLDDPSLYINREQSWLEFNRRVLEEAQDRDVPLMERLKFLAIFSSNLDEFFMVRVGTLREKVDAGITRGSGGDKMTPADQLAVISEAVRGLVADQYACFLKDVIAQAGRQRDRPPPPPAPDRGRPGAPPGDLPGAHLPGPDAPGDRPRAPVPAPTRTSRSTWPWSCGGRATRTRCTRSSRCRACSRGWSSFRRPRPRRRRSRSPSPSVRTSGVIRPPLSTAPVLQAFTPLETAIRTNIGDLFPGMDIVESVCFRVTRDSEFELDEDVDDLLRAIEENVKQRRRGSAVRLEIESDAPPDLEQFLTAALDLAPADVTRCPGMLDLTGLFQIHALPGYAGLRDPAFVPVAVKEFAQAPNQWAAIRARDVLVHHPYESFKPVVDFIEAAASDDRVLAIKQTLYRTSSDSPVVRALQRAADNGKQVTALIELKARLDEERNILWAKELEKAGVHVVFGFVGLKTHCKVALVVRRDEDNVLRRYVHLGTGNYNPQTARIYTDLGLFTANTEFADDVTLLFNYLTGYAELPQWRKLVVAPSRLLSFMLEKIDKEAATQAAGGTGRIIAKVNGLLEPRIVQALYAASRAGVQIDLICRGICGLRPGVPGVSENIRVVSVVDRFLEHSRVFYFGNDGDPQVYVGSADWMDRNLVRRVEVVFPVEQPDLKARLIDEILAITLADNVKCRILHTDGTYTRLRPAEGEPPSRSQTVFLNLATEAEKRIQSAQAAAEITPVSSASGPVFKVARRANRAEQ